MLRNSQISPNWRDFACFDSLVKPRCLHFGVLISVKLSKVNNVNVNKNEVALSDYQKTRRFWHFHQKNEVIHTIT